MSDKTKQLVFNLTILFVAICFSVFAVELFLRIFFTDVKEDKWVGHPKRFYEYDPILGWRKVPNVKEMRISLKGKRKALYQTNSKGIRGPEYRYDKPANEYRILILGDSFADGYMAEFNDLFSEVLKERLNNMESRIFYQVINSGTSGYSTDQELLFFQNEGKKYNPDITILMFCENDIYYNNQPKDWSMYYKPLFKIKEGSLMLTNVPVPKPDTYVYHDHLETKKKSFVKIIRNWLHKNSYLYNFIKKRVRNSYILSRIALRLHLIEESKNGEDLRPREFRVWERIYNEEVHSSWKITEAMLVKLKQETVSVGSDLLVFYIPEKASVYPEIWEDTKRKYGLSDDRWNPEQAGIELGNICRKNSINFMNPITLFKSRAAELSKRNISLYEIDGHWSIEGNHFVGEILAEYIYSNSPKDKGENRIVRK